MVYGKIVPIKKYYFWTTIKKIKFKVLNSYILAE